MNIPGLSPKVTEKELADFRRGLKVREKVAKEAARIAAEKQRGQRSDRIRRRAFNGNNSAKSKRTTIKKGRR